MPATSLQGMRVNMLSMLHQESNVDPRVKAIAKSAIFKANQFEIGTFNINKSLQLSSWFTYTIFLEEFN